ncbi:MAG: V-type ATP synthase subunit D [Oscillospiraceae bacterium]|nr:V-type ATP synthase subunit D [Oscillospiraceae bacterium]
MNQSNIAPTKGNLLNIKRTLSLSQLGFDLLDKKRNILIREMMLLIDKAKQIKDEIESTYSSAYLSLQKANIALGVCEDIANGISIEEGIEISLKSVMGVDIPSVDIKNKDVDVCYGLHSTNCQFDEAFMSFHKVKLLTIRMAEIENSVYRIAVAIKKTQSRANALSNIIIPNFSSSVKYITDALEEKEREEFSRMKVLKNKKV